MLSPLTHDDPVAVGGHLLMARLGGGGMGTVYLARSPGGRTVALKTLHAHLASDPVLRSRFRLETDAARIIGGHHGATVFAADPLGDPPWLATEYVLGPPLDAAVSAYGPLPETSVRAVGAALAAALGQLHASEVVHRDLKPSNVLIGADGPKIIDFGIARAAGDDRLTRVGAAAGTPAYMSPEQASGQEHTPAGDVFALAGVLVHAASGHGPFGTGAPADLLYRVRYTEPDLSGVPGALVPTLARALDKDPARRPTAQEFAAWLHDGRGEFADHLPEGVLTEIARRATEVWHHRPYRPAGPAANAPQPDTAPDSGRRPRTASRRRLLTAGGSALAATAVGGGVWALLREPPASAPGAAPSPGPVATAAPGAAGPSTPADKRQSWRRTIRTSPLLTPVAVGDDLMAVMTDDGLAGIGTVKGEERWIVPKVRDPRHVHSDGKALYALGPAADPYGHRVSVYTVDAVGGTIAVTAMFGEFDRPVRDASLLGVFGDTVVLAARGDSGGWRLLAVGLGESPGGAVPRTGRQLWARPLEAYDPKSADDSVLATVAAGRLILARRAADGSALELSARDPRTGEIAWESSVPADRSAPAPRTPGALAVDGRHVYVGGAVVRALRIGDGGTAWSFGADRAAGSYSQPAVRGGAVYAAEKDRGAVVLDAAKGTPRWTARTGDAPDVRVPPAVSGKHVLVMCHGGLRAIDAGSRREDWSFRPPATGMCLQESWDRLVLVDGEQVLGVDLRKRS
ncbi:PQQ-binding-like beta-propeller repeat protein [Streptomyces sp. NPDC020141]|uniref:protein kinase domain-containing protein n=1 Tax=Streptomyces sp. NPDC020141 TaxID=3365065 RepID=UPI0037A24A42